MKILKFGGSSIRDAERIKNVINIVKKDIRTGKIAGVVFSAFQGVTDDLNRISRMAASRNDLYKSEFRNLKERHISIVDELLSSRIHTKNRSLGLYAFK